MKGIRSLDHNNVCQEFNLCTNNLFQLIDMGSFAPKQQQCAEVNWRLIGWLDTNFII